MSSGYAGDSGDIAAALADDRVNDSIAAVRNELGDGTVLKQCEDCGEDIPKPRVKAMLKNGMTCKRCVFCQEIYDKRPKPQVRMLDHIL